MTTEIKSEAEDRAFKNSLFAAKEAAMKANKTLPSSAGTQPQGNYGITISSQMAPLPSNGLLYEENHPLSGMTEIEVKDITSKEENILNSDVLLKKGTFMDELISAVVIDKSIDAMSLVSGDRMMILFAARAGGYGDSFPQQLTCTKCEVESEEYFSVSEFVIKDLNLTKVNQVEPFKNLFSFTLPKTKKEVQFKFMTGYDEKEIIKQKEQRKKKGLMLEEAVTSRLFHCVVSIDGNKDKNYIQQFVSNLPGIDSIALRKHIEECEPGVDTSKTWTCPSCGHEEVVTPPLGISFLWPGKAVK